MERKENAADMNCVTYGITEEKYTLGSAVRVSYGIAAYENGETDGTASIAIAVHDITDDKEKLTEFMDACNRLELSADHLHNAVEDFLSE